MLWLDGAEQLISVLWIPKQIRSGNFETGERRNSDREEIYRCVYAEIGPKEHRVNSLASGWGAGTVASKETALEG